MYNPKMWKVLAKDSKKRKKKKKKKKKPMSL